MRFETLHNSLILENIVDDVIKKYDIKLLDLKDAIKAAHDQLSEKRMYYLDWIVDRWVKALKEHHTVDPDFTATVINNFIKYKPNLQDKDLNHYRTLEDVYDVLIPFVSKSEEEKDEREGRLSASKLVNIFKVDPKLASKVYENDEYVVVVPLNFEGSKLYGNYCADKFKNTWCTVTAKEYWKYYAEENKKQYYVLFKDFDKAMEKEYQERNKGSKFHFARMSVQVSIDGKLLITPIENGLPFTEQHADNILKMMNVDKTIFKPFDFKNNEDDILILKYILFGDNFTQNEDGTIDVVGDVNLKYKKLTEIPFKFGKVTGTFNCAYNELTSLKGCPTEVGVAFGCENNKITSLEYLPKKIGTGLYVGNNELTSLEGCPKIIYGEFRFSYNKVTSFEGGPEIVKDIILCLNNKLTSLEGCPKEIGSIIWCSNNLKKFTIDDLPKYVTSKTKVIG
jgi:hypothetical protein